MAERLPEPYHSVPLTTHPVVVKDESAERRIYPDRYTPESEELARAEVRVTGLGTGYPARRGQGCAGWLVECGNGQSFIFDAGPGTNMAFNTLRLPYWKATRFLITHFHLDHIADLPVYYDFGQTNGRLEPMHIHGPDGSGEGESTEAVVDAIKRLATWHDRAKAGLDPRVYHRTNVLLHVIAAARGVNRSGHAHADVGRRSVDRVREHGDGQLGLRIDERPGDVTGVATAVPDHMTDNMLANFGRIPDAAQRAEMLRIFESLQHE